MRQSLLYIKKSFSWQKSLKGFTKLCWPLISIIRAQRSGLNKQIIRSTFLFLVRLDRLRKKNGMPFAAAYLKACNSYVMKHVSGDFVSSSCSYNIKVSVTRTGLPRILPTYMRMVISKKYPWGIRWVLTCIGLYRVIPYPGKVKISTITNPFTGFIPADMICFIPIFLGHLKLKAFTFKWNPFVISAKGSTSTFFWSFYKRNKRGKVVKRWVLGNSTSGFLPALRALFISHWSEVRYFMTQISPDTKNLIAFKAMDSLGRGLMKFGIPAYFQKFTGRLAFKEEPGKVRVFAMVDCITQWLLKPLHEYIFDILRTINSRWECDGTFDQDQSIKDLQKKLLRKPRCFSYDLSAATDRLPIKLQILILNEVYPKLGHHWASLLVNRTYLVPSHHMGGEDYPSEVKYACGQPMGALSSWGMLALTHHFIVQYSAYKVFKTKKWFADYMILGDDIVICDSKVASYYHSVMTNILKVDINLSKSLSSRYGVCEFAKRLITPSETLSGWSLREFSSSYLGWASLLMTIKKYEISKYSFLRILGYGSKASGHIPENALVTGTRRLLRKKDWLTIGYDLVKVGFSTDLELFIKPLDNFLRYLLYPIHAEVQSRINKIRYDWFAELPPHPDSASISLNPWKQMASNGITSSLEMRKLRYLSFKVFADFFPMFYVNMGQTGNKPSSDKALIAQQPFITLIELWERRYCEIFVGSVFWEEMVWGRRPDFEKTYDQWVKDAYISPFGGPVVDKLPLLAHPPKIDPLTLQGISHVFISSPNEDPRMKELRTMEDFHWLTSKLITAYSLRALSDVKLLKKPNPNDYNF